MNKMERNRRVKRDNDKRPLDGKKGRDGWIVDVHLPRNERVSKQNEFSINQRQEELFNWINPTI